MRRNPLSRAHVALGIAIGRLQIRKTKKQADPFCTTVRHELWKTSKAVGPADPPSAALAPLNPREAHWAFPDVDAREPLKHSRPTRDCCFGRSLEGVVG